MATHTQDRGNGSTLEIPPDSVLAPMVRRGLAGWCVVCKDPISSHIGHMGVWIGCADPDAPMRAFLLVPDRRNRRADETPRTARPPVSRQPAPSDAPHLDTAPAPGKRRGRPKKAATLPQERRTAPKPTETPLPRPGRALGPQVAYTARYAVTAGAIQRLPPHDRKVYGLIARTRTKGATRAMLLDALNARGQTGRVDGAVRRLRIRKVITIRDL
jgi:hypothetical protein